MAGEECGEVGQVEAQMRAGDLRDGGGQRLMACVGGGGHELDLPAKPGQHAGLQSDGGSLSRVGAAHEDADAAHRIVRRASGCACVHRAEQRIAGSAQQRGALVEACAVLAAVVVGQVVIDQDLAVHWPIGEIVDGGDAGGGGLGDSIVPSCVERIVVDHQPCRHLITQRLEGLRRIVNRSRG